jgi:hypothetical protein
MLDAIVARLALSWRNQIVIPVFPNPGMLKTEAGIGGWDTIEPEGSGDPIPREEEAGG